jgi:tetratricopeptide (TPR) repeat protein
MKLTKILRIRIILLIFAVTMTACSNSGEKRVNKGAGPLSAGARNEIARNSPEGLVRIGEGFERSGNLANALNLYEQALANDPGLVSALLAKGRILSQSSKRDEGIAILETLRTQYPDLAIVILTLAQGYSFGQDYDRAFDVINGLADTGNATLRSLDLAGMLSQTLGESTRARAYYDKALQIDRNDSSTISHLALSFALDGEYESAIALLQPLLNNPRVQAGAKKTLANIYALSGQKDAAKLIVQSLADQKEVKQQERFYQLLDTIDTREKAIALLFNVVPKSVLERSADPAYK